MFLQLWSRYHEWSIQQRIQHVSHTRLERWQWFINGQQWHVHRWLHLVIQLVQVRGELDEWLVVVMDDGYGLFVQEWQQFRALNLECVQWVDTCSVGGDEWEGVEVGVHEAGDGECVLGLLGCWEPEEEIILMILIVAVVIGLCWGHVVGRGRGSTVMDG